MEDKKNIWLTRIVSLVIVFALGLVISIWLHAKKSEKIHKTPISLQQGTVFSKSITLQKFRLTNDEQQPFTNTNLKGHWSLLYFGFTRCQKICPTTLSELNDAYKILERGDNKQLPQVIFISIDPDRDTPTVIKKYVTSFNKHFIGATGSKNSLAKFTKSLGILYERAKKSDEKNYNINHSGAILIINPQGEWVGILTPPLDANTIANDLMSIQKERQP